MDLEARIRKATDSFFGENRRQASSPQPSADRFDMYDDLRKDIASEKERRYSSGARPKLSLETKAIIKDLAGAFCSAKRRYDTSRERGDIRVAKLIAAQYMQEVFLPAVEAIVKLNSVDEVLSSSNMLDKLDEYTIVEGNSNGSGYTKSFLKTLYQDEIGSGPTMSDAVVRRGLADIEVLLANGAVRTAIGKAEKLLKKIDAGQNIAVDDDYLILNKVISRS